MTRTAARKIANAMRLASERQWQHHATGRHRGTVLQVSPLRVDLHKSSLELDEQDITFGKTVAESEVGPGDILVLIEIDDDEWLAVDIEQGAPSAGRSRVLDATTSDRKKGLAMMQRVWAVAAPYYGRGGERMPRIRFLPDSALFVGWSTKPPGDLASILATGQVEWPDWVNRGFIGIGSGDDIDQDATRELLIHEWAHAFQTAEVAQSPHAYIPEGGAQAFTRRFAPDIYAAIGITYVNPPLGDDQYTMLDDTTDSGDPHGAVGWVEAHKDEAWIIDGQFRKI